MADGEQIFKPFVIMISIMSIFSVISISVIAQMNASITQINEGPDAISPLAALLGTWDYTLIDPVAGYRASTVNTTTYMHHPLTAHYVFTDADHDDDKKYIQIVRNNRDYNPTSTDMWKMYQDFISVQRPVRTGSVIWSREWNGAAISFQKIMNNFDSKTNVSTVAFDLSGKNDTMFFVFPANNTLSLWTNNYTMYYGWSNLRHEANDAWATVSMVLTAQVPGLDDRIQFVVTAVWATSLLFLGFTMLRRLLPW